MKRLEETVRARLAATIEIRVPQGLFRSLFNLGARVMIALRHEPVEVERRRISAPLFEVDRPDLTPLPGRGGVEPPHAVETPEELRRQQGWVVRGRDQEERRFRLLDPGEQVPEDAGRGAAVRVR